MQLSRGSGTCIVCAPLPAVKIVRENSAVPPGLESFLPLFPALKRCAKLGRPSGAGFPANPFHLVARKRVLGHTLKGLSSALQERPAHPLPIRLLPRSRIPSAHPDGCCQRLGRSLIENPCVSYLLPCSKQGLGQDYSRSLPESETQVLGPNLRREAGDLEAAGFAPRTLHPEQTAPAPLRPEIGR